MVRIACGANREMVSFEGPGSFSTAFLKLRNIEKTGASKRSLQRDTDSVWKELWKMSLSCY